MRSKAIGNEIPYVLSWNSKSKAEIRENKIKEIFKINLSLEELDTLSLFHCILSMKDKNIIKHCGKHVLEVSKRYDKETDKHK